MEPELLIDLRALAFIVLTVAAAVLWHRQRRSRPSSWLLATFGSLLAVMVISRFADDIDAVAALERFIPLLLIAMPWLLANFAWSFEASSPRWLRIAGVAVLAVGLWLTLLPPGPQEERAATELAQVTIFVLLFTVLTATTAVRLWTAEESPRAVASRLRVMAVAAVMLNAALVARALPVVDAVGFWATTLLAIASAMLFLVAFAAPAPLRHLWRQKAAADFTEVQSQLISATTAVDVTAAVVPLLSDLVDGAVAVVGRDGRVIGTARMSEDDARLLSGQLLSGQELDGAAEAFDLDGSWLIVRLTPYAPIFGREERELVRGLALHTQLALERAALFESEREARTEAEEAKRDLETTVFGLAHDLRNPTMSLSGFAQLLATTDDPQERAEMAEHLESSARYIERLVSALLELSRVGRTQTNTEPVDLTAAAQRVAQRWSAANPLARIHIDVPLPELVLNPVRSEQLLDNLVGNALTHGGREDITVTVSANRVGSEVQLRVSDNGSGVPTEDRKDIFELFGRGRAARAGRGSGIGLAMVVRIAQSYGGSVELTDANAGSTFVVRLPERLLVDNADRNAV